MTRKGASRRLPPFVDWENVEVADPRHDWADIIDSINYKARCAYPEDTTAQSSDHWPAKLTLDDDNDIEVLLVDSDYALEEALDALRESMNDSIVAIDLEWTPDVVSGFYSFVALMQLASSTRAVLIRLCCMDGMPYMLEQFLRDEEIVFVGLGWHNDEHKMMHTFGFGRSIFCNFADVATVAHELGYQKRGLASLAEAVLNVTLSKDNRVTRSNWAAPSLSLRQVLYAAQDALVCSGIFRELLLDNGNYQLSYD